MRTLPTVENQHRQIAGYRDLSQAEIDLMNRIKDIAADVGELVDELRAGAPNHGAVALDPRWVAIGATELQQGFMALVRAVAQPSTF